MSREVRRVPLDFDCPIGDTWPGYFMPDDLRLPTCTACGGDGYSAEARAIAETFYPHQIGWGQPADALAWVDKLGQAEVDNLVEHGRLALWRDGAWQHVPRTAEEVNAIQRSPGRGLDGHDAINRSIAVEFRCKVLGIRMECATCDGQGDIGTPEQRRAYEEWESPEPPPGPGWQLWQTVSEGGPVSPIFETPEELADWIIASGESLHGANVPRDRLVAWVTGLGASVGTMALIPGRGLVSGVELAAGAS